MVASLTQTQLLEQKDQQIAELTRQLTSAMPGINFFVELRYTF